MLFDLRGRGRRRTVQVIYLMLALLLGGGLVLFGIGGDVQGGLFDAFRDNSGGNNDVLEEDVEKAEEKIRANRQNAMAWAELAEAKVQLANASDGYDEQSGTYGGASRTVAVEATRAWEEHLELAKDSPNADTGRVITRAYLQLDQADKAVTAWDAVIEAKGDKADYSDYSYYAELAYLANKTTIGDRATQTALDRAKEQNVSKDRRAQIKAGLEQLKAQIAQQQVQEAQGGAGGAPPPQTPVQP
jgi:tetratricopeptide (TPR) repeat protein